MTRRPLAGVPDISEYFGIPEASVRDQVHRRVGIGQYAFRVGKYLRWEWADVDAFVQAQKEARSEAA